MFVCFRTQRSSDRGTGEALLGEDRAAVRGRELAKTVSCRPYSRKAELGAGIFAAHVIAAAVTAALQGGANLAVLFNRMVSVLKTMHDKNPSWGPMFVAQPSTITRHVAYIPIAREEAAAEDGSRDGRGFRGARVALAARGRKGA
jgi:hypothetical protein